MSEILFILTTLYVAYVVYTVTEGAKTAPQPSKSNKTEGILTPSGLTPASTAEVAKPSVAEEKTVTEAKKVVTETKTEAPVAEKPAAVEEIKAAVVSSNDLRDPVSGETAKVSNNYRGLKRWLKEALVTEGLLEKVYSVSELNDETNAKIKQALDTIKTMPKYHA